MGKHTKRGHKLILAIIIILILPIVIADKELIDKKLDDFETFTLEGLNYTPLYYPDTGELWLKVERPDGSKGNIIIQNCTDIGYRQYCVSEYEEDYDEVYGETFSTFRLKIEQREPDIDLDRKFSPSDPEIDEEVTVTATIKNDGSEGTKVYYYNTFPQEVKLRSGDVDRTTNTYRWSDYIDANSKRTFTYKIYFAEPIKYEGESRLTYTFDKESYEKKSSKDTVEVNKPYKTIVELEPERVSEGKEIKYTATIENEEDKTLEVTRLKVEIPTELEVIDRDGLKYDMTKSFDIYKDKNHEFTITLKGKKRGVYTIWTDIQYRYEGKRYHTREAQNISIGISDVKVDIDFPTETYRGCPTIPVKIRLADSTNTIEVPKVDMLSNLLGNKGWNSITFNGETTLIDEDVNLECADEVTKYEMTIDGRQKYNDMDFWFTGHKSLTVRPLIHKLKIQRKVEFHEKDALVKLNITNPGGTIWNLTIIDETEQKIKKGKNTFNQQVVQSNETIRLNYTVGTTEDLKFNTTYIYWKGKEMSQWKENSTVENTNKENAPEEKKTEKNEKPAKKTTKETTETKTEEPSKKNIWTTTGNIIMAIINWFSE